MDIRALRDLYKAEQKPGDPELPEHYSLQRTVLGKLFHSTSHEFRPKYVSLPDLKLRSLARRAKHLLGSDAGDLWPVGTEAGKPQRWLPLARAKDWRETAALMQRVQTIIRFVLHGSANALADDEQTRRLGRSSSTKALWLLYELLSTLHHQLQQIDSQDTAAAYERTREHHDPLYDAVATQELRTQHEERRTLENARRLGSGTRSGERVSDYRSPHSKRRARRGSSSTGNQNNRRNSSGWGETRNGRGRNGGRRGRSGGSARRGRDRDKTSNEADGRGDGKDYKNGDKSSNRGGFGRGRGRRGK